MLKPKEGYYFVLGFKFISYTEKVQGQKSKKYQVYRKLTVSRASIYLGPFQWLLKYLLGETGHKISKKILKFTQIIGPPGWL